MLLRKEGEERSAAVLRTSGPVPDVDQSLQLKRKPSRGRSCTSKLL